MPQIRKVYIASPLFNPSEKWENEIIDEVLRKAGYRTFLPQRDGFLFVELIKQIQAQGSAAAEAEQIALNLIFYLDVYQVCEGCDATVLNLNGRVPDEGAVSEGALCFRSERPLVIYKNDSRSLIGNQDNPLVVGQTGWEIVHDITQIPTKLKQLANQNTSAYSKTMKTARKLFGGLKNKKFDSQKLKQLIRLGKQLF